MNNKKPEILIISNYWHFANEKESSRYLSIANSLVKSGAEVEVVTSSFYHTKKAQRNVQEIVADYKYTLIRESGYTKNISVRRILSHKKFQNGVVNYLKNRKAPDVIYLFVPPIGLGNEVLKFCKKRNIKLVCDVLDLWPEAFDMVLPHRISSILLASMKRKADRLYAKADGIVTVSEAYLKRINKERTTKTGVSVYIGVEADQYYNCQSEVPPITRNKDIVIAYVGTLGKSYDLITLFEALKKNIDEGIDNKEIVILGDGPEKDAFEAYCRTYHLPVRFLGRIDYKQMVGILKQCDYSINILNPKSAASIINKHADYVAAGIPTINVQTDKEFNRLLDDYGAGFHCCPGRPDLLAEILSKLSIDGSEYNNMCTGMKKLSYDKFDRQNTYTDIIDYINRVLYT
ncbi:MAG: glycosyltransferase family 4 protein [Clostridia bacterium]|nr:glycosyltransferase family 4 protein [Clostridia bacterium]